MVELPLVEGDEIAPALSALIEAFELGQRFRFEGDVEDRLVDGDSGVFVGQGLGAQLGLPEKELLLLLVVLGGVDATLQDVEQRRTVPHLFVQRFEGRERPPIVPAQREGLLVIGPRHVAVAELGLRQLADAKARRELHLFVGDVRQDVTGQPDELGIAIGGDGEVLGALEPKRDLLFGGCFADALHDVAECALEVPLLRLGDLRPPVRAGAGAVRVSRRSRSRFRAP